MNQYFVAVTLADAPVAIMGILSRGRGSILPSGATWVGDGTWERPESDAVIFEEVSRTFAGQTVLSYRRVEPEDIPSDRSYRNALLDPGAGQPLTFDMGKARELHLAKLRRARVGQLEQLDIELLKTIGRGEAIDSIEARKQALRDMPTTLEPALAACKTIDDLKRVALPE